MSFSTSKNSANALINAVNNNNKNRKKISPSVFLSRNQPANKPLGFSDGFSDLSSNLSSNNLTCSDLDTTNNGSSVSSSSGVYDLKTQRKKLIKCILREDLDNIKSLINKLDLTKIRDKHKNTLLHIACGFGRLKSVQFLLSVCPQLLYENDDKEHNAVDVAIKHGQIDIIKWLLNSNLIKDFDKTYSNGQRSLLHLAAKHGENEILKLLCGEFYKLQLSIDIKDAAGNTSAHLAAKYNHLDCLQTLVEYNSDISITNKYGHTPCFVAEFSCNSECVNYLMIVETCINLSIKVVKLSRKLRETKSSNDILKAQMDEAIAINNDFINQRENTLFISLDLMNKQIQDIENKIFYEIDRLNDENFYLKQQIEELGSIINENNKMRIDDNDSDEKNLTNKRCVKINNSNHQMEKIIEDLNSTKNELINTRDNCNSILNLDNKKMENVKSKFTKIKNFIEMNETQSNNTNLSFNEENDIIENNEHFDLLRKVYQEATHRLLIFRNLIKEREKLTLNNRTNKNSVPDLTKHHAKVQYSDNNDDSEKISENYSTENSLNTIIENNNYENNIMNNRIEKSIKNPTTCLLDNNNNNEYDDFYIYSSENGLPVNEDYDDDDVIYNQNEDYEYCSKNNNAIIENDENYVYDKNIDNFYYEKSNLNSSCPV